jgi:hypothetical protein
MLCSEVIPLCGAAVNRNRTVSRFSIELTLNTLLLTIHSFRSLQSLDSPSLLKYLSVNIVRQSRNRGRNRYFTTKKEAKDTKVFE